MGAGLDLDASVVVGEARLRLLAAVGSTIRLMVSVGYATLRAHTSRRMGIVTMTVETAAETADGMFRMEIRPNRSINPRNLAVAVICLAVICLTIALSFFTLGLWLVLPFAGLEVFVVGAVVGYTIHRSEDCEIIVVGATDITVTRQEGKRSHRHSFARYWTRVHLEPGATRLQPSRLKIGSHGRFLELAKMATNETREELAIRLRQAAGGGMKST